MGVSPLYVNPVNMLNILIKVLAEGKGIFARSCLKEARAQSCEPMRLRHGFGGTGEQKRHIRPSLRVSQHNMTKPGIQEIG